MTESARSLSNETLSVGQLNRYLKYALEQDELLATLSVYGEISELSRSASGHFYLTLKDATSQISCVLFRKEAMQQRDDVMALRAGVSVVVHGFLTVYEPRGTCQIFIERIIPHGPGALAQQFEKLKARLEAEGLFASERKRPLPEYPRTLAIITSPRGQAYHDVLHRLNVQYPFVKVILAGVSVQGDGAADEVVMALDIVNRMTDADVVLIVRGGGSPQDLAAFNDERLARAVFASRLPVISGVGHQNDHTIVDYVADFRAATPSLAAAAAVPDASVLANRLGQVHAQIQSIVEQRIHLERSHLLDAHRALVRASPEYKLRTQHQRLDQVSLSLRREMDRTISARRARLQALRTQLTALDPLAILKRGYAVLSGVDNGTIVSSIEAAPAGALLRAQVSDGHFLVRVEKN